MSDLSHCILSEAEPVIRKALERLLDKPQWQLPICIVTHYETMSFVQFAGSVEEKLLLDVPQLGYSERIAGSTPESVAHMACSVLRESFSLPPDAELVVKLFFFAPKILAPT